MGRVDKVSIDMADMGFVAEVPGSAGGASADPPAIVWMARRLGSREVMQLAADCSAIIKGDSELFCGVADPTGYCTGFIVSFRAHGLAFVLVPVMGGERVLHSTAEDAARWVRNWCPDLGDDGSTRGMRFWSPVEAVEFCSREDLFAGAR
jgi:hypothetical protein